MQRVREIAYSGFVAAPGGPCQPAVVVGGRALRFRAHHNIEILDGRVELAGFIQQRPAKKPGVIICGVEPHGLVAVLKRAVRGAGVIVRHGAIVICGREFWFEFYGA